MVQRDPLRWDGGNMRVRGVRGERRLFWRIVRKRR